MFPNNLLMQSSTFLRVSLVGVLMAGLQACGGGSAQDLRDFVETAYQDKKPDIEPLPVIEPYQGFTYSAFDLNDPYSPGNIINARDAESRVAAQRDVNRRREALEEFPLDALAMVGTMSQNGAPWVIVQTAIGTAHLATIGNYLGQNEGKIKEIFPEEQRIVIEESVLDPAGRLVAREVEMTIDELQ
ncbi:pilus assembly protein PilP [Arenicella xantha]|uniref:Type IV pilus assembly protein PilP n=1 Tax=Arenicella xantha TaxID=644221 RepID=A0A395JGD1_9GAMM|nr:pilus assembly protein PilP [Arenicella xantha]RBP48842.1 type IV pilus assembly protein PilP [Arenicella xantha]